MNELTQKGIDAFKSGDLQAAQDWFRKALQQNPADETAWLWLAGTFADNKTRILCLEKALEINPNSTAAQKGLAQLRAAPVQTPVIETPPPVEQTPLPQETRPETASPIDPESAEAMLIADDLWPEETEDSGPGEMTFFDEDSVFDGDETGGLLEETAFDEDYLLSNSPAGNLSQADFLTEETEKPIMQMSRDENPEETLDHSDHSVFIRTLEAKPLPKGRYAILIPGFEDHQILLKPSNLSSAKLFFDSQLVKRGKKSKCYELTSVEGLIARIELRPSLLDPLPQVIVDGEKLVLAPPLKWYQWVWMGIPLIALVVLGGAIGAIFGITALLFNIQIFRSRLPVVLRYLFTFFITLAAVVLYLVAATYLNAVLQGYALTV